MKVEEVPGFRLHLENSQEASCSSHHLNIEFLAYYLVITKRIGFFLDHIWIISCDIFFNFCATTKKEKRTLKHFLRDHEHYTKIHVHLSLI